MLSLFGLLIKNSPAEHYFNLITPVLFLITAIGLSKYKKSALILLVIFSFSNLFFLLKRDYYMNTANNNSKYNYGPALSKRIEISKYIVNQADGKPFNIKVIGDFDIYPSTTKNYEYLAFWLKGKPKSGGEVVKYIIYEPKAFAKHYPAEGVRKEFENAVVEYRPD